MTRTHADVAVIGAGIVGVAVARQLVLQHPGTRVVVFDKEKRLASHASGRNSGVLHAGFYYSPDSLKARLTRRGNTLLREFCTAHAVPVVPTGKVVVARGPEDLPRLADLAVRAAANGVPVDLISPTELAALEPLARTHEQALWSPTTAVADPRLVLAALAADARRHGVTIRLDERVRAARPGQVLTAAGRYTVGHTVNCAGLQAAQVAGWFGMADGYSLLPFKGLYRYLDWTPGRLQRLVYPVPDPAFPFLGVHVTVTPSGRVKIGPTALPVLSAENYTLLRDVDWRAVPTQGRQLLHFLRSRAARRLVAAEIPKYRPGALVADAAELVPEIRPADVAETAAPGIRAQLVDTRTGALETDYVVRGDPSATHVLNAVSPAWTSALAFAELVVTDFVLRE